MYQIGESFTRFKPSIDFAGVTLPQDPAHECALGAPPSELAAIHAPALINAWHAKLVRAVADPVQIEQRKGHRRVHNLGVAVFDFEADGTVQLYVWHFNVDDMPELERVREHEVVAQGSPYQALWMNGYKAGALRALQRSHPGQEEVCQAYVNWANNEFVAVFWGQAAQDAVRAQITETLALDPQLLEIACNLAWTPYLNVPVRLDAYNHVVHYKQDYLTLQREAPTLIPLYSLLSDELDDEDEVTFRMKLYLKLMDVDAATWRLLCRVGSGWMLEFLPYLNFKSDTKSCAAVDLVLVAQAFGTAQLVPAWLLHAVMQTGGNPNRPSAYYAKRLSDLFPLCKRLGHLLASADQPTVELLQQHAIDIFSWGCDHLESLSKTELSQISVRSLLQRVDDEDLKEALQHHQAKAWKVPYQVVSPDPQVSAVILDSPLAVWQEGRSMHHCARRHISKCAKGTMLMLSLRSDELPHPVATVAFAMDGPQVRLQHISGFANRLVPPAIKQLALECGTQLETQRDAARARVKPRARKIALKVEA